MKFGRGELVNKSRCCAALGLSRPTFDRYAARGMPIVEQPRDKGGEYKVYLGEVVAWLAKNAAQENSGGDALDLNEERARLAKEQADYQELKNAAFRGELIPAAEVVEGWQAAIGRARSLLLGIPPAAAEDLAILAAKDPAAVQARLADLIHDALQELADTRVDEDEDEGSAGGEREMAA